jgi:hypothetical protein
LLPPDRPNQLFDHQNLEKNKSLIDFSQDFSQLIATNIPKKTYRQ